jgi:hypothetical protein
LTQTLILLRERSHKTQNPRFEQASEDSARHFLKSPSKNKNLEAEPNKSVTVTGIKKTESLTSRKRPVSGGKPVVTTDSMET